MPNIPADALAQMERMPRDFAPPITDNGKAWVWRGHINVQTGDRIESIEVEYGLPKSMHASGAELKPFIWQILELARLGRADLLGYARCDRHKRAAVPVMPQLPQQG